MKKLYLFIFMIVMALSQNTAVYASTYKPVTAKVIAPPAAQTIAFTAFTTTQTFGAADVTLTATATSGLAVSFSSSNTSVATIVANKIHLIGPGTAVITAYQAGDGVKWAAAANVTQNLTVNAGPQAVLSAASFPSISVALQSADVALPATSTNYPIATYPNNPIIYSITGTSGQNVATIINNRLHMLGTGTVTISATQPGNGKFADAAALSATYTLTAPAIPVFTNTIGNKALGTIDFDPGATFAATAWTSTITYSTTSSNISIINNKVHLISVGTAIPITATITYPLGSGGTATVSSAVNTTLNVTAAAVVASPVINFTAPGSKAFSNVDFTPTITSTSTSTSPITLTSSNPLVATIVNGNIHYVGVGTSVITADQGGIPLGVQGSLPADVSQTLTVTAPTITLTNPGTKTVNTADFAPAATASLTNIPVTFSVSPASIAVMLNGNIHLTGGTGTVTLTATQSAAAIAAGYPGPADATTTFTVGAATTTIPSFTFAALGSKVFTNTDLAAPATSPNTTIPITLTSSNPAVATINSAGGIHYVGSPPAPNNTTIITASQGGGTLGSTTIPPDVQNLLTVTPPLITFPTIGTKPYTATDYSPGATSNNAANFIYYTSSNPAVATINNTLTGTLAGGTGYTNGTYNNIALVGGSGSGAVAATVIVASGVVTTFIVTTPSVPTSPSSYAAGDVLTLAIPNAIGNGSGFSFTVTGITSLVHFNRNVPAAPNNTSVITATQGGGVNGIPYGYINGSSTIVGGSGYTNGTYTGVPLTGGSGTGALATVVVSGGAVTSVLVTTGGSAYTIGNVLSAAATNIGGTGTGFSVTVSSTTALAADVTQVLTLTTPAINFPPLGTKQFTTTDLNPGATGAYLSTNSIDAVSIVAGSGYTNGNYYNVPLAGGTGTGATANITVINGVVTSVLITNPGTQYSVSNVLTPATPFSATGSGFSLIVSSVSASLPVTYTSSNPAVATIVNGFIHFTGAPAAPNNTTVITASQSGPAGGTSLGAFAVPAPVSQTLTVTPPTITFNPLGTKTYSATDLNPGASSPVNTLITYTSSNTAVATINNSGIAGLNKLINGSGYTSGTYIVPLSGGTGTGATAQVIVGPVSSFTSTNLATNITSTVFTYGVSSVNILSSGSGYSLGDVLTVPATSLNSGSNVPAVTPFSIVVSSVGSFIHYIGPGTTNITASQGGGATGTLTLPADVTQALTVTSPVITFAAVPTQKLPAADLNPGATSTLTTTPISYTSSNTAVATVLTSSITGFNLGFTGTGYVVGSYPNVPLTGGTGTGATANITVVGGSVFSITVNSGGTGYTVGDVLTTSNANLGGSGVGFVVSVASVSGVLHFVAAGTTNVTATQGGGATGTATLPADVTQPVTVSPFTITFAALGSKTLTDVDYTPTATSTNTNVPITYTSSNQAVATIVGGNIHYISTGTTTIEATEQNSPVGTVAPATGTLPGDVAQVLTVTAPILTYPTQFGAKTTLSTDFAPGATSTLTNTAINYTSSNTAVATITPSSLIKLSVTNPGINYVSGTYTNVPLTGGSGSGATANVTIIGGLVGTVAITNGGTGYKNGDVLSATPLSLGGIGTGLVINVVTAGPVVHITGPGTSTITATQGGGATGTTTLPADIAQTVTVTTPVITFPALGTKQYSNVDLNPGASSTITSIPITYTSSNAAVATINTTLTVSSSFAIGSGYTNGTYPGVALTGGNGAGAIATIVVAGNVVQSVTVTTSGTGYLPGDLLTAPAASIGGTGSGFSIAVTGFNSFIHFNPNVPASPNNTTTIKASQGGGATASNTLPADVSQVLTVTAPTITFPALGSIAYGNADINPGATSSVNLPITYTSSNTAVAVITAAGQIRLINAGTATITASQGGGAIGLPGIPANATSTLTVTGGPLITFAALGSKAINTTDLAPGATSTLTTVPIVYTSTNPAVATIVNGNIHFVATGTTTIEATQQNSPAGTVAGATATLPADQTQVLTVTAPVITFTTAQLPATKAIQSVDLAPGATSTLATVPITYTSSDATIATIVNGNIHFVGLTGNVTITASQGGGASGTATLPKDVALTVAVTAPTITFTAPGTKAFAVVDFTPVATSTLPTIPITFTSSDPNVATIVNGNIHYVGLGTCTITASQQVAANAAGLPAPPDVQQSLTVTAPSPLVFTALGSKAFSSTDLAIIGTVTSSLNQTAPITFTSSDPTVATIVNNQLHYVGIGSCIITASQAGIGNIPAPLSATSTLTVTPAVLTVAPTSAFGTLPIGTADATLAYTSTISTTTFPVTYTSSDPTVATVIGGVLHITGTGTCVITGNQFTGTNYQPLPTLSTLNVTAIPATPTPTISLTALGTRQYSNNGDITPTATVSNGTTVTFTSSNPAVATIINGNVHLTPPSLINGVLTYPSPNTTVITATQGGGPTGVPGSLAADVSTTLTVTPAGILFPPLGVQKFNTNDLAPGATSTYIILNSNNIAQPITYTSSDPTVATIVNGNIHFVGLGTVDITASLGNVIVPDVTQTMTVVAPAITFAATASRPFSSTDLPGNQIGATSTLATAPITYTSSNPAVATIVNGNLHFVGIGITTITASQPAVGNSTAPLSVAQTLTVVPPTLTFAASRTLAFTLTDVDPAATSTLTTVPITYTSSNPALVTIVNGKLHFPIPTSNLTSNTAVITATQLGSGNIPLQTATQTLIVNQAILFPNPLIKAYGDPDFNPAVSTFGTGYPVAYSSATTTVATTVNSGGVINALVHVVGPGTSVITGTQAGDALTTAAASTTATLTVTQAPMTITPKNVTITYGSQAVPVLPVSYYGFKSASGGVPLDDSTKFSTQPTVFVNGQTPNGNFAALPVGTYTLNAAGAVSTLYTFTYGTGTLTIVAAPQTLTWLPGVTTITKTFGSADFDPLARSTGDPLVYTSSDPTVATVNANGTVHIVSTGTCTLTATLNPTSGNYTGSAVLTKTLVVVPGNQTITVNNIPDLLRNAAPYTPTATASSGLPVTVSVTDPSFVKIVNGNIVPLHVGTTQVTFSQAGNANWNPATSVLVYVNVVDPTGSNVLVHQAVSPNGDGVNDFLYIEGISNYPVNHVKIVDRNGGNVFETDNYDNKNNVFTGKSSHNGKKLPGGTYFFIVDYNIGAQQNHITGYFVLKY